MEHLKYKAIDFQHHSFRLIRLCKANEGPVQCELFLGLLDDPEAAIEYEALSYTWGMGKKIFNIEVDGCKVAVTENLYQALHHLRLPDQDRSYGLMLFVSTSQIMRREATKFARWV